MPWSASCEIREQTDLPHLGSSGATVKAGVTKDDARDPSKRHAISRAFNTALGKPFRCHILNYEECHSLHMYDFESVQLIHSYSCRDNPMSE